MKAYQIQAADGIEGLKQVDCPEPTPGIGQVLVRVHAVSLNDRDTLVVGGQYPDRVSLIGVLSGAGAFNHTYILHNSIDVQGIFVGSREMFEGMNAAIALHQINPVIDRVFPFSEAPEAYGYLQRGKHFGKVVIKI
jgi:NADPH:quinone reductase-like Zn-dependent oxidoreductase